MRTRKSRCCSTSWMLHIPQLRRSRRNSVDLRVWTVSFGLAQPRLGRYWPVAFLAYVDSIEAKAPECGGGTSGD